MLKPFVIFFLLVAVTIGSACRPSAPTPNCPFTSWQFYPPGVWECSYSGTSNEYDSAKLLAQFQGYKPFTDFYAAEIEQLHYTIRYFYDPTLPPGDARTTYDVQTRTARVTLGNMSEKVDLAFVVAHELAAVAVAEKGFPGPLLYMQSQGTPCANVANALYDMMSTPARDSLLASYGFNVEREFYAHRYATLLTYACGEGNGTIENLPDAFVYVQLVLYWQMVLHHSGTPSIIDRWFHDCFPYGWAEGQSIKAMIPSYITMEGVTAIFREIIEKYNLQDCIPLS
jgi:hypothetical protein